LEITYIEFDNTNYAHLKVAMTMVMRVGRGDEGNSNDNKGCEQWGGWWVSDSNLGDEGSNNCGVQR
jgi:hypothetical protein